jgi:GTP-binding protein HflX
MEGAIGLRGPGETQIETDRRLIRGRIKHLRGQLEQVRTQRGLYRRQRERSGVPVVALVGYTNAGKSTLMRALSGADVLAEDKLFATLDPVTRRVRVAEGLTVLLTDTVGFIQKLPTQLVAAFRATLEELQDADVLLHVVDISHPKSAEQNETVEATLKDLGVDDKPRVTALNKVDLLASPDDPSGRAAIAELRSLGGAQPSDAVLISAANGWGLDDLRAAIARQVASAVIREERATSQKRAWRSG